MMETQLLKKDLTKVGEEISHELGAQMIKDFQIANPLERKSYLIGKNILIQILSQPGCVGMRFYSAIDEEGVRTLVYVGVDENNNDLIEYQYVTTSGTFETRKAIVADRTPKPAGSSGFDIMDPSTWF
jgi:hypothetical protein